jgi:hypothetical protein
MFMVAKSQSVRCSNLRARLHEATGRRLLVLGVGVLAYLTLVSAGAFYLVVRLIPYFAEALSPAAVAAIAFATLAGIATVVRAMPGLLLAVVKILDARKPETAGLVPREPR